MKFLFIILIALIANFDTFSQAAPQSIPTSTGLPLEDPIDAVEIEVEAFDSGLNGVGTEGNNIINDVFNTTNKVIKALI